MYIKNIRSDRARTVCIHIYIYISIWIVKTSRILYNPPLQ